MRRRPTKALVAVLVASALLGTGQLAVHAASPAGSGPAIADALSTLRSTWPSPTTVDRATITAAGTHWTGELSFSDGSTVSVVPSGSPTVVSFASRTVTSAQLTVRGTDVALASFVVDGSGASSTPVPAPPSSSSVSASSNSAPVQLSALADGDPATGSTGAEWSPASSDASPWVRWSYSAPRSVATIQVVGPSASYVDPQNDGVAAMNGTLTFSDGSTLPVSGIGSGANAVTTVSFAPRTVSWVRLQLARSVSRAVISLREARVYSSDETAPHWAMGTAGTYRVSPAAAGTCTTSSTAVGSTSDGSPALVCPAIGTRVSGPTTVVVQVGAGATLNAAAWVPSADGTTGSIRTVATATADSRGRAALSFDSSVLSHGPYAVRIQAAGVARPMYAQLDNGGGIRLRGSDAVPSGMTERFADEFTSPVSISDKGLGTEYMAKKPESWGGSSFGEAVFADPAAGANTIATVDDDYLRIRAQPLVGPDPNNWGRTTNAGLLSSAKTGMTGFSAQNGYFEARILGAPGKGTWPAFWIMSTDGATPRSSLQGEADAVELYGHDASYTCRTTHDWASTSKEIQGKNDCRTIASVDDWALAWHTYGVRVTPTSTDYYIDGQKVVSQFAMAQNAQPFYFMLNLAAGGGYPIDLSATGGVSDMYVDWVRVYT